MNKVLKPSVTGKSPEEHIRGVPRDIIITLVTCGIYNLAVQNAQMHAINDMLGEVKYKFLTWFLLTLVTCGLYHLYFQYQKCQDIAKANNGSNDPTMVCMLLTIFGLSIVADALLQGEINKYYGGTNI